MSYQKYSYADLKKLCEEVFNRFGYSEKDSAGITDVLLTSDLFGIESHGIQRLALYCKGIRAGRIDVKGKLQIVKETPVSALIDGNREIGQIVGMESMRLAIRKAGQSGIGMTVVRNSNHFGIAGYYARMAQLEGMIGIAMTNTRAAVVPTNGREMMLGTNPIAISMPAEPVPFLLDMATSTVTMGKMEVYNKNSQPLPEGWALGKDGTATRNAGQVIGQAKSGGFGGLLPLGGAAELFGGHKGYGLALAVEMFTSILSGGNTCYRIRQEGDINTVSHTFMAVDYGMFGDKKEIEGRMSDFLQKLRDSAKADGCARIYTHGEKESEAYMDRMKNGIPVNDSTLKEIRGICESLGMNLSDYITAV